MSVVAGVAVQFKLFFQSTIFVVSAEKKISKMKTDLFRRVGEWIMPAVLKIAAL